MHFAPISWAKKTGALFVDAGKGFAEDRCWRFSASLAYYAMFSIFPLLLLCVSIIGYVLGDDDTVRERVLAAFSDVTSAGSRQLLDDALRSMQSHHTARGVGAIIGVVSLIYGASSVFSDLETSLDSIWRVKDDKTASTWRTVLSAIKDKAFSFLIVVGAAALLLMSLAVDAVPSTFAKIGLHLSQDTTLWRVTMSLGALVFHVALVAILFRVVPHAKVRFRDVIGGSVVTALVLTALKAALTWYLSGVGSYAAYGAVGAILALLTWMYFAALGLFFGAELCRVYATRSKEWVARSTSNRVDASPFL